MQGRREAGVSGGRGRQCACRKVVWCGEVPCPEINPTKSAVCLQSRQAPPMVVRRERRGEVGREGEREKGEGEGRVGRER